jgi:hypothetical protein
MNKKTSIINILILFIFFAIFVDLFINIFWDGSILMFSFVNASETISAVRGQWGDVLSGHFSALAFIAVAYSIYQQRIDMKKEREYENFKLALELMKELDDKQTDIEKIDFEVRYNQQNVVYAHPIKKFSSIRELEKAIDTHGYFDHIEINRMELSIEILAKLDVFYTTVKTLRYLLEINSEKSI